jgi:hypothetical protein
MGTCFQILLALESGPSQKDPGTQAYHGSGASGSRRQSIPLGNFQDANEISFQNSNEQTIESSQELFSNPIAHEGPEIAIPESDITQTVIVRKQAPRARLTLDFSSQSTTAGSSSETTGLPLSIGMFSEPLEGITEEKSEVSLPPSLITVEKAVATKVFFEKHYGKCSLFLNTDFLPSDTYFSM